MRFTTKTEYGLVCMAHMARHKETSRFTLKQIADKEHYPISYIEKIMQHLKRAGLVTSLQGNHGGWELAKKPSEITLLQIIEALEGSTFDIFCAPETRDDIVCTHFCLCGIKPVWRKTKNLLDEFYGSITLDKLALNEIETQNIFHTGAKVHE